MPIMGRGLRATDYQALIDQSQSYLAWWRNKFISYAGRIQLSNWVLMGQLIYWFQGVQLPTEVLKKACQMINRFVWDGGKGMAWWGMILSRSEGGLGLCDLVLLA